MGNFCPACGLMHPIHVYGCPVERKEHRDGFACQQNTLHNDQVGSPVATQGEIDAHSFNLGKQCGLELADLEKWASPPPPQDELVKRLNKSRIQICTSMGTHATVEIDADEYHEMLTANRDAAEVITTLRTQLDEARRAWAADEAENALIMDECITLRSQLSAALADNKRLREALERLVNAPARGGAHTHAVNIARAALTPASKEG